MQDPYIETFSAMSARLDELGAPHDTDLPITLLEPPRVSWRPVGLSQAATVVA